MTDNRLDQIQDVLTELVRIVGNTNAAIEELRTDVAELKASQKKLEQNQDELKEELAQFTEDTFRRFNSLDIGIEYLANKLVKHDMQLYEYKKLKY